MQVLSEQIKLTFKINVKSHPWYEGRQARSSGMGRDILRWAVEANSPLSFWPGIRVPFYLLSPRISSLLEDICYRLITRTARRTTASVGAPGFWQLWGAAALWTVSHLIQSWCVPPVGRRLGGRRPGERGVGCSLAELSRASRRVCVLKPRRVQQQCLVPPQPQMAPSVLVRWDSRHASRAGSRVAGRNVRALGSAFSFLPRFQKMQFTHWFLAPKAPRLKKNIQGDSVWAESPKSLL